MNPKRLELTGQKFGRLTVIAFAGIKKRRSIWQCKCECGKEKGIIGASLVRGYTKSCGCLHTDSFRKMATTHGDSNSKEFAAWEAMMARCYNKNYTGYHLYGGRNIRVCRRWHKYKNFLADMGRAPTKQHTVDRIRVNGNYQPKNCKWSTRLEQANNRRTCIMITYQGKTQSLAMWAREFKLNYESLHWRKQHKWPIENMFKPTN